MTEQERDRWIAAFNDPHPLDEYKPRFAVDPEAKPEEDDDPEWCDTSPLDYTHDWRL